MVSIHWVSASRSLHSTACIGVVRGNSTLSNDSVVIRPGVTEAGVVVAHASAVALLVIPVVSVKAVTRG